MLPLRRVVVSDSAEPSVLTAPRTRKVGATLNASDEDVATVPPFKDKLTVEVVPLPGYAKENAPLVLAPLVKLFEVVT